MGIEEDFVEDKSIPVFSGYAIRVRLPDQPSLSPQGKHIVIQGEPQYDACFTITFPEWAHKIYMGKNQELEVLGADLEKDMIVLFNNYHAKIWEINKEQLYHGMMTQQIEIGYPTSEKIPRYKFTKKYLDNNIEWSYEVISK